MPYSEEWKRKVGKYSNAWWQVDLHFNDHRWRLLHERSNQQFNELLAKIRSWQ